MPTHSTTTIPTLIHRFVLQAVAIAIIGSFLFFSIYSVVLYYEQQRQHIEQLGEILADSASNADGASLVARQVAVLLEKESSIESIVFYSTDHPMVTLNQADIDQESNDWYNALFSTSVIFNQAVTSRDNERFNTTSSPGLASSLRSQNAAIDNEKPQSNSNPIDNTQPISAQTPDSATLIGYINITLNVSKLRKAWLSKSFRLWLAMVVFTVGSMLLIIRKLNLPYKDVITLAKVCDTVIENPELKQLPMIQQHFRFQEFGRIRMALITLFNRLDNAEQKIDELAAFEEQLYNKDLSLDVQRSNFQGMITHELKTSLNAISGALQLLNIQNFTEEQADILAIIRQGSQHLDSTLEQIIQLNKIEKGQIGVNLTDFNPLQLLADLFSTFEPMAKKKGLELVSKVQHIDYTVAGDVTKIKQILSTLIENAIKFTTTGQVIVESQLNYFSDSIRWQVKVIDHGIGIDSKNINDIFSPFFQVDPSHTREYGGLGVGLSVAKQTAHLIGASIEVSSQPDIGSEFTVIMPLRNSSHSQRKYSLKDRDFIYYYYQSRDFIFEELQHLGATVTAQQAELAVLEQLLSSRIDMVMIAEDVAPDKAAQLASYIREQESNHRVLIIYWYAANRVATADSFNYNLKAAGIDFCHVATRDTKVLHSLLETWLS